MVKAAETAKTNNRHFRANDRFDFRRHVMNCMKMKI